MKSLHNYISEKLVINKNYSYNNSVAKILDGLQERKSVIRYDGWGFGAEDENVKNIYNDIKDLIVASSIKEMPKGTESAKINDMLKKGDAIVSFNNSVNDDPYISFISMWENFSADPFLEINITLYKGSIRVSAFVQDRLLGHCPHASNVHHVIPKKILLELFKYVYDNDMADNRGLHQSHTFKEIYDGIEKRLK